MKQIVSKDKRVLCTTTVPYPAAVIKDTKKAGYKVVEIRDKVGDQK